eukprot:759056-Hanusia_phi.AAC.3
METGKAAWIWRVVRTSCSADARHAEHEVRAGRNDLQCCDRIVCKVLDDVFENFSITSDTRSGHWESALRYLNEMRTRGLRPDRQAKNLFKDMKISGIKPDVTSTILQILKSSSITPDITTANCIMIAHAMLRQWEKVDKKGLKPDVLTYNALITALANGGETERALQNPRELSQVMRREQLGKHWRKESGSKKKQTSMRKGMFIFDKMHANYFSVSHFINTQSAKYCKIKIAMPAPSGRISILQVRFNYLLVCLTSLKSLRHFTGKLEVKSTIRFSTGIVIYRICPEGTAKKQDVWLWPVEAVGTKWTAHFKS